MPNPEPIFNPIFGALIETHVKPYLQKSARRGNKRKALDELTFFGGFEKYLERAYARHSELTTLALQGKPRSLLELYIPLTLQKSAHMVEEREEMRMDCYPDALLPRLRRVLLIDDAGMGKSTLVKFLFLKCVEARAGLPILIELRRLRAGKTISDVLTDELCEVCPDVERAAMSDAVRDLLNAGEFVFFLDGYDEIPFDERERVTLHLREFVSKTGHDNRNAFLVSSRPEPGVSSLPGFHGFQIRPLKREEAFTLLRKYDDSGELSQQLITELEQQMQSVEEFLTNPMLVSLLFDAYEYKRNIPLNKAAFYRQVYDALFERHDTMKPLFKREKYSKLDKDGFERVLRALAIRTLKTGVGYGKDDLLRHIGGAREMCAGLTFAESDFLQDLLTTVPLFAREGDYHGWKHKSLQEYFAAGYICGDISKEEQAKALRQMVEQGKHFNVLSLCYDIGYRTFRNTVIYDLVKNFLDYYATSFAEIGSEIEPQQLHERRLMCFGFDWFVFHEKVLRRLIKDEALDATSHERERRDIFVIMHNYLLEKGMANANVVGSTMFVGRDYSAILGVSRHSIILTLLHRKSSELIRYIQPQKIIKFNVTRLDSKISQDRRCATGTEIYEMYESEDVVTFSEDPNAPCNSAKNFRLVNSLLSAQNPRVLNVEACRAIKAEIEADLERESSDSVASWL